MKKIAIVVALGLVIGAWWTRDDATPRTEPRTTPTPAAIGAQQIQPTQPTLHNPSPRVRPTLSVQTLEPTSTDPIRREHQETLWRDLRAFASAAKLTDVQWDRFVHDLIELAEIEAAAWAKGFEGVVELSSELAREMEGRAATYMTADQVAQLRFHDQQAMIIRVRQLHIPPPPPAFLRRD